MSSSGSVSVTAKHERMSSLDGLRGLAAMMVLNSHCMLLIPSIATVFISTDHGRGAVAWLVTYTPLHAFWAGTEAVFVFFVLSGFVLTRAARAQRFSWRAYYPSRLLRLYLPVLGALAFAVAVIAIVPRTPTRSASWWLKGQEHVTANAHSVVRDLFLVRGADALLPPLWSLKWEVVFSLLLPVAVVGASRRWQLGLFSTAILLTVTLLGADTAGRKGYLLYLPMFGVGAIMATQRDLLARWGRRLTGATGAVTITIAVVLLTSRWTAHDHERAGYRPLQVVGAALVVFAFGYWTPLRRFGETRPLQWLGKRSFSLYLVHYQIVLSVAILLGRFSRFAFVIAIPLSLIGAEVFFRLAERPSHRFSQLVKARLLRETTP